MNLPGVIVDLPTITEKDRDDLVNFGVKHGVDLIAACTCWCLLPDCLHFVVCARGCG